ncbi:DUF4157 domain-containing protein [Methylocapsa polymorpha]|uniref:DUF4157 domain-containing protein n=1 Tax=Methylocapsa polymorpha TaxID=3080828 RepID=A0ABZ0HU47_9HYPH|nr:DUF4157 domain-containing protein [Methylocapsa sp. RX1]
MFREARPVGEARSDERRLDQNPVGANPCGESEAGERSGAPTSGIPATRGWLPPVADSPRLRIGRANDPSETEADAAAEQALSEPAKDAAPSLGAGQGRGFSRPGRRLGAARRRPGWTGAANRRRRRRGPRPHPRAARFFEPRFGHDFAAVRVHAGPSAAKAAKDADAQAFALGDDIFFGAGEYRSESEAGRRLLAHELAHTIQARPNVVARRALPLANDLPDASADAGPAQPGADDAANALASAPEGDESVARDRLNALDPLTQSQALARMRERLPAGEADKASGFAHTEGEEPKRRPHSRPPLR